MCAFACLFMCLFVCMCDGMLFVLYVLGWHGCLCIRVSVVAFCVLVFVCCDRGLFVFALVYLCICMYVLRGLPG